MYTGGGDTRTVYAGPIPGPAYDGGLPDHSHSVPYHHTASMGHVSGDGVGGVGNPNNVAAVNNTTNGSVNPSHQSSSVNSGGVDGGDVGSGVPAPGNAGGKNVGNGHGGSSVSAGTGNTSGLYHTEAGAGHDGGL